MLHAAVKPAVYGLAERVSGRQRQATGLLPCPKWRLPKAVLDKSDFNSNVVPTFTRQESSLQHRTSTISLKCLSWESGWLSSLWPRAGCLRRPSEFQEGIPGIDLDRPTAVRLQVEQIQLVSVGLWFDRPITALKRRIWPRLQQRWPDLKWRLIGKNERAITGLVHGLSNVEVTGPVLDAVTELARAAVVVVPLLAGSGTRLKILEAWAAGRAIVSTSIGAAGIAVEDGRDILLRDEPEAFADAVAGLLDDSTRRLGLGDAGRVSFERSATWYVAWQQLDDLSA